MKEWIVGSVGYCKKWRKKGNNGLDTERTLRLMGAQEMAKRAYHVFGVVQGVGFRPFIYRLAMELGLAGIVRNEGDFVHIELQGGTEYLQAFLTRLKSDAPPAAVIVKIQSVTPNHMQFEYFQIVNQSFFYQNL